MYRESQLGANNIDRTLLFLAIQELFHFFCASNSQQVRLPKLDHHLPEMLLPPRAHTYHSGYKLYIFWIGARNATDSVARIVRGRDSLCLYRFEWFSNNHSRVTDLRPLFSTVAADLPVRRQYQRDRLRG